MSIVIVRKRRNGKENNDNSRCREASIMTPALRTAHATAADARVQDVVEEQREKFGMALIRQVCYSTSNLASHREELGFILSGILLSVFLRAASLKHCCIHICRSHGQSCSALWAQSSAALSRICFTRQALGSISPRRHNCFHTGRNFGPFSLAQVQIASARAARLTLARDRSPQIGTLGRAHAATHSSSPQN